MTPRPRSATRKRASSKRCWAGSEAWEDWAACSVVRDVASHYALPVQDVIDELSRLPGIGPKSAQRIAYHLLRASKQEAERLATAITDLKERIGFCERCFNIAEGELCHICRDERRDGHVVCVVEEPKDVVAIER